MALQLLCCHELQPVDDGIHHQPSGPPMLEMVDWMVSQSLCVISLSWVKIFDF
jgi:hypothetical protein